MRRLGPMTVGRDGDISLYHVGNNQLHASIYRRALERPGVIALHDAVLQHFFLGSLDRTGYVEEFVHNYGEWIARLRRGFVGESRALGGGSAVFRISHAEADCGGIARRDCPQSGRGANGPAARTERGDLRDSTFF